MNFNDQNEKSKYLSNKIKNELNSEYIKHNSNETFENHNHNLSNSNPRKKFFLQFSEPLSKQVYNTNPGYYDENCRRNPVITMTFPDLIPNKTTINIKMFDSLTNKLIAELPLPLNIIPFDKKVSSKFRMINKFDESTTTSSYTQTNKNNTKLIDFDIFKKANNKNTTDDDNIIPKNTKIKKNVPKIKLFLMIHLSTFGQLPFHAQKGTLLKHLKDATRIKAKTICNRKDLKNKALSLNNIKTPTPTVMQQETTKNCDLFSFSKTDPNINLLCNSKSSTDYSENNEDSSSEVVETLFVDNMSDLNQEKMQQNLNNQNLTVFVDDIKKSSHKHGHHHRNHGSSSHHHGHKHHHHSPKMHQQNHLSDDQDEVKNFDDKKQKNPLVKIGSCGDIPTQCLLTDILVE